MFSGHYAQLMAQYNQWMNQKLYAACAELDDAARKQDRGAFFGSIHNTLNHLLWGDSAWLCRFTGRDMPGTPLGQSLYDDFESLRAARTLLDQQIIDWAAGIDPHWLASPLTWSSKLYGFTQTQPHWILVTQMFNHQTHHRGQITTMLSQLGIDIGVTDLPLLPALNH